MAKFAPWTAGWLQDPWPEYRALREEDPVYWSEEIGHWILTRYNDVVSVLRDRRFTATNRPPQRRWNRPTMMVTADPPAHSRLRRPVAHQFGSGAVEALRPMMQSVVDELLEAAAERGQMDVAWDYARVLPRRIITHIMGVPYVPPERPRGELNAFGMQDPPAPRADGDHEASPRGNDAGLGAAATAPPGAMRQRRQPPAGDEDVETEQERWFNQAIARHRDEVRDDVLQTLLSAESGGAMSEEEVLDTATILYGAGQETTGSLVTNAMFQLLRHPDQLRKLQREPELLRPAVEELMRYDAPVHSMRRKALVDVEIGGQTVKAGEKVLVMLMAANHDPEIFAEPDKMDLAREDNYHIAFGSGVHTCLGGILARAEAQVAIGSLVARFPKLRLAGDGVRYTGSFVLRTVRDLPVRVD
jgi:cytochrome P450